MRKTYLNVLFGIFLLLNYLTSHAAITITDAEPNIIQVTVL